MARVDLRLIKLVKKFVSNEEYMKCVSDTCDAIVKNIDHDEAVVLYDVCKAVCDRIECMR